MKLAPVALLLASLAAAPAIAEDAAEAPAAKLTIDSTIETLMANEATKAVVVKHLGAMDQHPAYGQFKGMSLIQLQPWSQGQITDEIIAAVKADLEAL